MSSRQEYLNNLPKKISSAGALFCNADWEILLLKTHYKEDLEIPGGIIEENESPKQAAEREVKEELWIEISLWKLLVCEYQITDEFVCYAFIFDGGIITQEHIDSFVLAVGEIKSVHFLDKDDLWNNIKSQLKNRIKKSMQAKKKDNMLYYETD